MMNNFLEQMRRDYGAAEITLAWAVKQGVVYLLFARVDLLPKEFTPETDSPRESKAVGDNWSVGHQKLNRSVEEALQFYKSLVEGRLLDISGSGSPIENAAVPPRHQCVPCSDLRIAPVREKRGGPPYLADWQVCPRYHEVLAREPKEVAFVSEGNRASKAAEWLAPRISFDLASYGEYWGGAVLVAPNPLFRAVDERLWPNPEDASQESVLVRLHLRRGQYFSGLKVTCSETESGASIEAPFATELAILNFDHRVGKVTTAIRCPKRGPLYATEPLHFIRSIHGTIGVLNHKVKLNIEDKIRNKTREVEAQSVTRMDTIVGEAHEPNAQEREEQRRQRQDDAARYDQVWFDAGNFTDETLRREEILRAQEYIRTRLNRARKVAWIIDPYFGALDFLTYFGAVHDWSIPIKILTSAEFLRCKRGDSGDREWDALLKAQQELKNDLTKRGVKSPPHDIKVMPGDKAALHDRFIIADQEVWTIGSSLNEFGSRGSLALRLPDPEPVIKAVERVWRDENTLPFADWMARRISHVGAGIEEGEDS